MINIFNLIPYLILSIILILMNIFLIFRVNRIKSILKKQINFKNKTKESVTFIKRENLNPISFERNKFFKIYKIGKNVELKELNPNYYMYYTIFNEQGN